MKHISILFIVMSLLLTVACKRATVRNHIGDKLTVVTDVLYDSIIIDADSTSLSGNFVLMDSSLIFVDQRYCKIFAYSVLNGKQGKSFGGFGKGPNEMTGIMYGASISPADTLMWIIDSSIGVYEFSLLSGQINYLSRLDFSRDKFRKNDYSSPSVYNIMEMSDFGVTLHKMGDKILIPLSLINRRLDDVEKDRYTKGKLLGSVDISSLKVDKLIGSFPNYYLENPSPYFEFFDYAVNPKDSVIYVNHAPDSLIYCYRYPDQLLYTIGFEPKGINRDYTIGYEVTEEDFKDDIQHVGVNTGMYYDSVDDLLFRTSMSDFKSGRVIMQAYQNNNLILECEMPAYFKLLGRINDRYYGVRFLPIETDNEEVYFILYSFDKLPLNN